jgi:hypothetical protein
MKTRIAILTLLLFGSLLGGCHLFKKEEPAVATVGDYRITQKDIEYRDQVIRVYYPDTAESYGLKQLVASYTHAQVLKNNGVTIDESTLNAEIERIDKTTQAPETLERIKKVFGDNKAAYKKVFILPTFADRTIYFDFFRDNKDIHAPAQRKAEDFLAKAIADPKDFKSLAEKQAKKWTIVRVSEADGVEWGPKHPADGHSSAPEGKRWISEYLLDLMPGQVYPKLIAKEDHWISLKLVAKKVVKKSATYELEAAIFSKQDYGQWLDEQRKNIKVVLPPEPGLKQ